FNTKKAGIACFNQAVYLYNERRPHMSIGYRTPSELDDMSCNGAARLRLAPSSPFGRPLRGRMSLGGAELLEWSRICKLNSKKIQ
ncbi:MAG: hypothetical protein QXH80_02620, partial [Candidatus Nanoarchaeia archaeon]